MLGARGAKEQVAGLDRIEAAGGTEAAEQMMRQTLADAEIDPGDPDFAAVEGVDVDQYARICKQIVDTGPQVDEQTSLRIVGEHGVDPAKWVHIAEVWNERVLRSHPVKMRYSRIFMGSE
jgi:hypothetical protein